MIELDIMPAAAPPNGVATTTNSDTHAPERFQKALDDAAADTGQSTSDDGGEPTVDEAETAGPGGRGPTSAGTPTRLEIGQRARAQSGCPPASARAGADGPASA